MSLRKGNSASTAEGSDPPYGSGTSPHPSGPPTHVEQIYRRGGVRGRHVPRRRRRGRESSAGRLAHPPHSMRVVEACSAAAARGAAFVRPHCRPHITEVHSAAVCAASAEPVCRIKWIRRHITFSSYRLRRKLHSPFSYAAGNAASYPLAPFRQDRAWLCRTEDSHG